MIKEIRINTFEELMQLFAEQEYQNDIKRYRNSYVYRGIKTVNYKMETSLKRNCKDKQYLLEDGILKNFTKYACLEDPSLANSVWRQMISGQHHGLPTRLLDFTGSPLIALHFAAVEKIAEYEDEDCEILRIDMAEIHSLLPQKYQSVINESRSKTFSLHMLDSLKISVKEYDEDMKDQSLVIVEPSSIDKRIVSQYSFFAIMPQGIDDFDEFLNQKTDNSVRYIISKDLRWRIADTLDSFNVSERVIYPGLDGLSAWIARHYYVRD